MSSTQNRSSFEEFSFLLKVLLVYASWKALHWFMWADPHRRDMWQLATNHIGIYYAHFTSLLMNLFGCHSYNDNVWIQLDRVHFMWVADHCLALPAMFVFVFSMLLFRGSIRDKLWFIPLGLAGIFIINLTRLVSLGFLRMHLEEASYQVYHKYVFLLITYGLILAMVFWWMNRVTRGNERDNNTIAHG